MKETDLTEKVVAELKEKHGPDLQMYKMPDDDVLVFHKPNDFMWSRWLREGADEKKRHLAIETLALSCLAMPSVGEAKESFKKYPAAPLSILEIVTELGGGGGDTKKL
jgi:hypothetical protein